MAIARFPSIVLDCPDPGALAKFYGALLEWKVDVSSDWAEVRADYGQCISFQQVKDYTPPEWPNQEVPQQMHLDVIVDDLDIGEAAVLAALDEIAAAHDTTLAAAALAWLLARPQVVAPIASARTTEQLEQILPVATLTLTPAEIDRLSATTQSA